MKVRMTLAAVLLCVLGGTTHAGLLPVDVNKVYEQGGTRYEYSVLLQSDAVLKKGDFFTIYDFAGYIPDSNTQPSNFSFSTANTGLTPSHLSPSDDPSIPNLTFTYTGTETQVGELGLGTFSALSQYYRSREDYFTGQTHRQNDGHYNGNITDTLVPVPCHTPAVPEPSTLLLLGLALPLGLGVRAMRKARLQAI